MPADDQRQRIIHAAYACVGRWGVAKTTVEDVARQAGVSRATVYRTFPGGRDELLDATVGWATLDFFVRLAEQVREAETLEELMERGLRFAHRNVEEHEVLQRVMQTEPEKLLPPLTVESNRVRGAIAEFLVPFLEHRDLAPGLSPAAAADFLARMALSYIGAPGRWDLDDPVQVAHLVRAELLAGIVGQRPPADDAGPGTGRATR